MRRLRDFQPVLLQVGDLRAPARTVAVGGSEAVIHLARAADLGETLLPARATLSFEAGGHPVMLSGMAADGPIDETLRFFVIDGIGREDHRLRPRLTARLPARLTPQDAPGAAGVVGACVRETIDLCSGGALVAAHPAPIGTVLGFEVALPGVPAPLRAPVRVLRQDERGTALAFVELDPTVRDAVDRVIFTVRRELAREAQ